MLKMSDDRAGSAINIDGVSNNWDVDLVDLRPVFRGLTDGGVAGKELAKLLGVAPSTISKWRRGTAKPHENTIQFRN